MPISARIVALAAACVPPLQFVWRHRQQVQEVVQQEVVQQLWMRFRGMPVVAQTVLVSFASVLVVGVRYLLVARVARESLKVLAVPTEDIRAVYKLGAPPSTPPPEVPPPFLGSVIGTGQMARVRSLGGVAPPVCVKTVPSESLSASWVDDLRSELEVHARLHKCGVAVPLYSVHEDCGDCSQPRHGLEHGLHIVMLRGECDLHSVITAFAPFSEQHAAVIFREVLRLLRSAHEDGVMLRDLKPENIVLVRKKRISRNEQMVADEEERRRVQERPVDESLRAQVPNAAILLGGLFTEPWQPSLSKDFGMPEFDLRLIDFGLSLPKVTADSRFSAVRGTPHYLAPELCQGDYTRSIDVFSAGVVLHQLLVGFSPFAKVNSFDDAVQQALEFDLDQAIGHRAFGSVSMAAKALLSGLLQPDPNPDLTRTGLLRGQAYPICKPNPAQRARPGRAG